MEYIDKEEEKKKKEFISSDKKQSNKKMRSAKELMSSFQKENTALAQKYGLEEKESSEEQEEQTIAEEEKESSGALQPLGGKVATPKNASPKTTLVSPVESGGPENKNVLQDKSLGTEESSEEKQTEDAVVMEASSEVTEAGKETESGSDTRITEMKDASLDGGPERIKSTNDSVKQKNNSHLNEGANEQAGLAMKKISLLTKNEKDKESPEEKKDHIEGAVQEQPKDKEAEKQASKVKELEAQPKPEAKKEDAKNTLISSIENHLPTTVEGVESFKKDGIANLIGDEVKNTVEAKTQEIHNNFSKIEKTDKPDDTKQSVPLAEIEKSIPTSELKLGEGLIPKVEAETLDLSSYANESDNLLKREGIKQEHLDMVDSGDLAEANSLMEEIKTKSEQEPGGLKKEEQEEHNKVNKELGYHESLSKEKMEKERASQLGESKKRMGGGVGSMETRRKEVTNHIQKIYENTNQKVQEKLDALKTSAFAAFDREEKAASQKFSDNVTARLDAFKKERYSGVTGGLVELWDDHLGDLNNNPEVKKILDEEKDTYIATLDASIGRIMSEGQKTIDECKTLVSDARAEIDKYVSGLEPALKKIGEEAQADIKKKLDELDAKVNKAAEELRKELEEKKATAIANIEKKIDDIKESLKSTLGKVGGLLLDAAMKFFQWALEAAGYATDQIMGILNKGKAVITAIVDDPVQFMSNLANAVGGGIKSFGANIQEYLGEGFMTWMTGQMSALPIQLPEKWDLKGIMSLVMQVLGLGWNMLRGKLSAQVGEDKMAFVENHASEGLEIVGEVKEKGPIALWDMVSEKAEEIKEGLVGGAKEWAIFELVKQGIIKLASMLNPAGAIVQAILAIYGGVMFFVDNKDRIVEFVNSILNSIGSIAQGAISSASKMVEKTMALTIPLILDFLAKLLNLGAIAERITKIIERVRKPIDKVIERIINFFSNKIKKLFGKGKADKRARHHEDHDDPASGKGKKDKHAKAGEDEKDHKESRDKSKKDFDKDKGDDKTSDVDRKEHERFISEIHQKLANYDHDKIASFDELLANRQELANKLEKAYNKKIKKGLKVTIDLKKQSSKELANIGFTIDIAPNTTHDEGVIIFDGSEPIFKIQRLCFVSNEDVDLEKGLYDKSFKDQLSSLETSILKSSKNKEIRENVRAIRRKWDVHKGVIYSPFVLEQQMALSSAKKDELLGNYILTLETGGTLLGDQLIEGTSNVNVKIPKAKTEHKTQQPIDIIKFVDGFMEGRENDSATVNIVETMVSGSSANNILKNAIDKIIASGKYPNIKFKMILLQETLGVDADKNKKGVQELRDNILIEYGITEADKIQLVFHKTRYILGEDVDAQAAADSKESVIVFKGSFESLICYKVSPQGKTKTRDIIIALANGKLNGKLPNVL